MIFPGDTRTPKVLYDGGGKPRVSEGVGDLFKGEVRDGKPSIIDLSEAGFLDQLRRGRVPPVGNWKDEVEMGLNKALGESVQSFFGLNLQNMGMIGNGKIIEGVGGLASDIYSNPEIRKAFERSLSLPALSQGLGTAQFQTASMYAGAASSLIKNTLSTIGMVANSSDPARVAAAVSSSVLGAASTVLMMVPSPFGVTQIVGGIIAAVTALVAAFTGGTESERIAKATLYQATISDDSKIAKQILENYFSVPGASLLKGSKNIQIARLARGQRSEEVNIVPCDISAVFMPKHKEWSLGDCDYIDPRTGHCFLKSGRELNRIKRWSGWQQVRSDTAKRNVAITFEAGKKRDRRDASGPVSQFDGGPARYSFMPGTMRMQLQMQVPLEPLRDRDGNPITSVDSFRMGQKAPGGKWRGKAIPYSKVSSMLGTLPHARDLGSDFTITNNLCSNIWSTMVNRPGPLMYSVDAGELNDAWRIYFESFYEMADRWWSEASDDAWAWRSAVLKVCSLMTVEWDDLTCSWRSTGESRWGSNWMGKTPKDSKLNLKWSRSIYEQIIRPALINLAERQYEYLHTSLIAYLPEKAAAYNDPESKMGKLFREGRAWLSGHDLKHYLSMDDVIDPRYRDRLGPSAGSKANSETPVIFAIARGLSIPAPMGFHGGIPGSIAQSEIVKNVLDSGRGYNSTSSDVQMHRNILEECSGKGPEGDALRTLCEGALMYKLMRR